MSLRRPQPPVAVVEAEWPSQSSLSALMAAAVKLVVVVAAAAVAAAAAAGGAVEGAAVGCSVSVAVGSDNQVTWGVFDGVEALSCVLVMESLFGWIGSEGRNWAEWWQRMEASWVEAQHHWHYQTPWSLQGLRGLE